MNIKIILSMAGLLAGVILVKTVIFPLVQASASSVERNPALLAKLSSEYNKGNYDALILEAETVLESDPRNVDALNSIATAYAMKGSIGFSEKENGLQSIAFADQAIAIDPSNSEAYRIKGYAFEIQEQYSDAHQNYDKAIELDPKNFQALSNKGHAYDLQGDLIMAENFYRSSIDIYPQSEHVLLNIARLYVRQSRFDSAKQKLYTLISTSKNLRYQAEAYQTMAEIHRRESDYHSARMAIDSAIALDPQFPQAWVTSGRIHLRSLFDKSSEAEIERVLDIVRVSAEKALALNPNQATAHLLLSDSMIAGKDSVMRQTYKERALKAIDYDITLGQEEKKALKEFIQTKVKVVRDWEEKR